MRRLFVLTILLFVLAACGHPVDGGMIFSTADPNLSIFVPLPPSAPIDAPEIVPDPIAVELEEEEADQVACEIKVNVSSDDIVFHLPGGVYYNRVKVDFSQGDFYACTEQEAIDAGARKSSR